MEEEIEEESTSLKFQENLEKMSQEELKEKFIPPVDCETLEMGLHVLAERLLTISHKKLPRVVLFLETASRPLAHAMRPVVSEVYRLRGVQTPSFSYLNIFSGRGQKLDQNIEEAYGGGAPRTYRERFYNEAERKGGTLLEKKKDFQRFAKLVDEDRSATTRRLEEIREIHHLQDSPSILVVDDYVTAERSTMKEARRAIKEVFGSDENVLYFAFLSGIQKESPTHGENEMGALERKSGIQILIGRVDPAVDLETRARTETPGFAYKRIGEFDESYDREGILAVRKRGVADEPLVHVERSHLYISESARILRNSFHEVGRRIVERMREKRKKTEG